MQKWLPYCGEAPDPGTWWTDWNFDPFLIAALLSLSLVGLGLRERLRLRPAVAAMGTMVFLYVSPFCALGSALFTVRIVHDVILATLLAPLLIAALRIEQSRIPGSLLSWTMLHTVTFWLWHAPALYAQAMSNDAVFWLMQATLTGTASGWWAKVLRAPSPAAVSALLATMVAMGALGALLAFVDGALYAPHWLSAPMWGWSPLEDQQIAGIVMWAPASLVYLFAALAILYRSLGRRALA